MHTFCQEEGILLQKYRSKRNGRCIAILFKSIGVRGRCDSPDVGRCFKGTQKPFPAISCDFLRFPARLSGKLRPLLDQTLENTAANQKNQQKSTKTTPLNPTPATCHKRKQKSHCNFRKFSLSPCNIHWKSAVNLSNLGNYCQIWPRVICLC